LYKPIERPLGRIEQSNSLADLAARIHQQHDAASNALKSAVDHAIAAGELLLQAKEQLKHGTWLPWLQANCEIPERTVQAFMRLARLLIQKRNAVADLPLREALSAIRSTEQKLADAASRQAEPPGKAVFVFEGPDGGFVSVPAPGLVVAPEHRHLIPPSKPLPPPPPPPTIKEYAGECIRQLDQYLHELPDAVDVVEVRREIGETIVAAFEAEDEDGSEDDPAPDPRGFIVAVIRNAAEKANIARRNLHHVANSDLKEIIEEIDALTKKWGALNATYSSDGVRPTADSHERARRPEGQVADRLQVRRRRRPRSRRAASDFFAQGARSIAVGRKRSDVAR